MHNLRRFWKKRSKLSFLMVFNSDWITFTFADYWRMRKNAYKLRYLATFILGSYHSDTARPSHQPVIEKDCSHIIPVSGFNEEDRGNRKKNHKPHPHRILNPPRMITVDFSSIYWVISETLCRGIIIAHNIFRFT